MARFRVRAKPFEIEAILWLGGKYDILDTFCGMNWGRADAHYVAWNHPDTEQAVVWNTLEKCWLPVPVGFYLIRGMRGELYPCQPEIFETKYEGVI